MAPTTSTGYYSTIDYSGFGAFDKPCTLDEWENAEKPSFLYFYLTEWIIEKNMTEEEKENHPDYKTTGGYLRVYDYKEAWKRAWDGTTEEDRELLYKLPNFDKEVFKKISGIDVDEDINDDKTQEAMDLLKRKGYKIVKK